MPRLLLSGLVALAALAGTWAVVSSVRGLIASVVAALAGLPGN